jgi:hypothetical protein
VGTRRRHEQHHPGHLDVGRLTVTGVDCDAPPLGSEFYPFWSLNDSQRLFPLRTAPGTCVWNFGNVLPRVTTEAFGKDAEYGAPDVARYGGTIISSATANPEFSGACRSD